MDKEREENVGKAKTSLLERYFEWHGSFVARHPVKVIATVLLLFLLSTVGLQSLYWETNAIKLWLPQDSEFVANYIHLWQEAPVDIRNHAIICTVDDEDDKNGDKKEDNDEEKAYGNDILQPEYLRKMFELRQRLHGLTVDNQSWSDVCFRIPIVNVDLTSLLPARRKRSVEDDSMENMERLEELDNLFTEDMFDIFDADGFDKRMEAATFDPSVEFFPQPYCSVVKSMTTSCLEESILELWADNGAFSNDSFGEVSRQDILDRINYRNSSGLFLMDREFKSYLGGVKTDDSGNVVGAKATIMRFYGRMDTLKARMQGESPVDAFGEAVDARTMSFESALISEFSSVDLGAGLRCHLNAASSFSSIASSTILSDTSKVFFGLMIVFVFVVLVLGRFDKVETRVFLSLTGLASVSMALLASLSICALLGLPYTPLHNFIPFLLLGLGIDDMFVIVQSFENDDCRQLLLHQRFARTMKFAGAAITVTSITDVLAFVIGTTSSLPALRSFCVYCAVAILLVYLLQSTWFLAFMTLDQRRIEQNRNGFLVCIKHDLKPNNEINQSRRPASLVTFVLRPFAKALTCKFSKAIVLLSTALLLVLSVIGTRRLSHQFEPIWFLPRDSYLVKWSLMNKMYFSGIREEFHVFLTNVDMPNELKSVQRLVDGLKGMDDIVEDVDDWYSGLQLYYQMHFQEEEGMSLFELDARRYNEIFGQFLFSPLGSKYRLMFQFADEVVCGQPAPHVKLFMVSFKHSRFSSRWEQIEAMERVKRVVKEANFTSGRVFPFSKSYASWEIDSVLEVELQRNLLLAFVAVFVTTLILLCNVLASFLVLVCVTLTITNVAGIMHFWGVTIEIVSCTNLIICVGLCVDYAAHVAHTFLHSPGSSRDDRVVQAILKIGPAVLNGAFSTFLSVVLLATSNSHVFETFFKIFCLVVVFALFNGMVLLPVLLTLLGHRSTNDDEEDLDESHAEDKRQMKESETKETRLHLMTEVCDDNDSMHLSIEG